MDTENNLLFKLTTNFTYREYNMSSTQNLLDMLNYASKDFTTLLRIIVSGTPFANGAKLENRTAFRTFFFIYLGCSLASFALFGLVPSLLVSAGSFAAFVLGSALQDV